MRALSFLFLLLLSLGCDNGPRKVIWTQHQVTEAQETRQEELLQQIHPLFNTGSHVLEGVPKSEYEELLSLADKTGVLGDDLIFSFTVISDGDVHEPSHMDIVVTGDKIKWAQWSFADF